MESPTFPVDVAGCQVYRNEEAHDPHNLFGISSFGRFGGHHVTVFSVDGDAADIQLISKHGRYRTKHPKEPLEKHVQALRALGFTELAEPGGRRYDITEWPIRRKDT
jgi:hypothetical protein